MQNKDKLGQQGAKPLDKPMNRELPSLSSDKKGSLYEKPLDRSLREPAGKTDHPNTPSLNREPPVISFLGKGHAGSSENDTKPSLFASHDSSQISPPSSLLSGSQPEEQTLFPPELPEKPLEQTPENPEQSKPPKP